MIKRVTRDTLSVKVDGLVIQGPTASRRVLVQLREGTLEPYEAELFEAAIKPGMTVLDLGANIGYYTLLAARRVGTTGRVFAFEPDPRTVQSLRSNIRSNGFENVTVLERAVSDRAGTRDFFLSDTASHSGLGRSMAEQSITGVTTVQSTSIDEVLDGATVAVIKMDIEGGEVAALRGMERTLAGAGRVSLFIEVNEAALAAHGSSAAELVGQLESLFDEVGVIDEKRRALTDLVIETFAGQANLLCRRRR